MRAEAIDQKIQTITQGKLQNFRALYQSYAGLVRGALFRLTPRNQIDDLVQETFLKIWRGLERFEGRSTLKVWIYQIVHHVAIDGLRKKQDFVVGSENLNSISESSETRSVDQDLIRHLLQKLSLEFRSVIILFFLEELSLNEISEVLAIPVGTVKSRLHTAKLKMEEELKNLGVSL